MFTYVIWYNNYSGGMPASSADSVRLNLNTKKDNSQQKLYYRYRTVNINLKIKERNLESEVSFSRFFAIKCKIIHLK